MKPVYRHYGWESSYFTVKSRACLRYKPVPAEEIVPDRNCLQKFIVGRVGRVVMPILVTPDDQTIQDTSLIIDHLEAAFPEPAVIPDTPRQRLFSYIMETFCDEWLLLPAMHYRWNFPAWNRRYILHEFGSSLLPKWPPFVQRFAGRQVARKMSGYLPRLGITPATEDAIERWTIRLLDHLDQHFSHSEFLLGRRPSLGDFALFGPLYAHLYRDPYPGRLVRERESLTRWILQMQWPQAGAGGFYAGDRVPETLDPLLELYFTEVFPVLRATAERVADWLDANPENERVKMDLGMHDFTIAGVAEKRTCFAYSQWMLQRPLDCYRSITGEDRVAVDAWLERVGGLEAMGYAPRRRVKLEKFRLFRE